MPVGYRFNVWATGGKFFEYLEASKSSKRSYTQFSLTLFIRGFFLKDKTKAGYLTPFSLFKVTNIIHICTIICILVYDS